MSGGWVVRQKSYKKVLFCTNKGGKHTIFSHCLTCQPSKCSCGLTGI